MFQRIGFPGVTNFQVLLALAEFDPDSCESGFFRLPLTVGFTGAEIVNIEFECLRQLTRQVCDPRPSMLARCGSSSVRWTSLSLDPSNCRQQGIYVDIKVVPGLARLIGASSLPPR